MQVLWLHRQIFESRNNYREPSIESLLYESPSSIKIQDYLDGFYCPLSSSYYAKNAFAQNSVHTAHSIMLQIQRNN